MQQRNRRPVGPVTTRYPERPTRGGRGEAGRVDDERALFHRPADDAYSYQNQREATTEERRRTRGQPAGNESWYYTSGINADPSQSIRRTTRQIDYPQLPAARRLEAPVNYIPLAPDLPTRTQTRPQPGFMPVKRPERVPASRSPIKRRYRRRPHLLTLVGLAMLMIVIAVMVIPLLLNWWQVNLDNWRYGTPRTYQTDAVVGHADSITNPSHFIALNLNQHIEVIEFPGGNPSHAKVYLGPTLLGAHQELVVVTLTFKDVNGDGKPDMLINLENSQIIYINEKGMFRPARPGDHISSPGL